MQPLPRHAYAIEAYPPHLPVAKNRLEPLGARVCETPASGPLTFDDNSFNIVIDRQGDISAVEIHRILKPGKSFITQQVGGRNNILQNELFQDRAEFRDLNWTLDAAVRQLDEVGFRILGIKRLFGNRAQKHPRPIGPSEERHHPANAHGI